MFSTGLSDATRIYFSAATAVIGIPTAIKIFAWSLGLSEIKIRNSDFILVFAFVICFVFGGFTGLILANSSVDLAYHDTYFVVGHFHFVLSIAAAISAALFFTNLVTQIQASTLSFPFSAIFFIVGILAVNILFGLQHLIGIEGHPRRIFLSPEIFVSLQNFCNISILPLFLALSALGISIEPGRNDNSPNSAQI
jgi:cytochrome c oxidase subunit 1